MIEIQASDICYGYIKNRPVISGLSFEVERGVTLGLVGSNGSGKSTLLQLIAGIIRPNSGAIVSKTQKMTLLSLNAGLQSTLSGRMNARLSGMLLGMRKKEVERRLEQIKEFSELGDAFEERVESYSTGMRARLGFATATQLEPDVLLIDEILGVGDQQFREKSTAFMNKKIKGDTTVVLVSHNSHLIRQLCDVALWLDHGTLRALGPTAAVIDAYVKEMTDKKLPAA